MPEPLTVHGIIDNVHTACMNMGMDLAPSDVGFIVNAFLQSVIDEPSYMHPQVTKFLQTMADEAASLKDDGPC